MITIQFGKLHVSKRVAVFIIIYRDGVEPSSGVARIFPVGAALGDLGFSYRGHITFWIWAGTPPPPPPPPKKKSPHLKKTGPHFPVEQADKQNTNNNKKEKKCHPFCWGGGGGTTTYKAIETVK